jgi:hypothetical protein
LSDIAAKILDFAAGRGKSAACQREAIAVNPLKPAAYEYPDATPKTVLPVCRSTEWFRGASR